MIAAPCADQRLRAVLARTRSDDPPAGAQGAAVLVALMDDGVLLTRRAEHLRRHAGQVAFPGGRIDATDSSAEAAALREAEEEIGLPAAQADLLGRLPCLLTRTGYHVIPVVARITGAPRLCPAQDEVASIFVLPTATLRDPAAPTRRSGTGTGAGAAGDYWVWPHCTEYIWGATASILVELAAALAAAG